MMWRCWETTEAGDLLGVDAGPPDELGNAAFLATHSPQKGRLLTGDVIDVQAARAATSVRPLGNLLDELERDWPADQPMVWALGAPGTGKSHLVRLLSIEIERRHARSDDEHIVFVPKSATSSLKRVLDLILAGQEGEDIAKLRKEIEEADDSHGSVEQRARRLANELGFLAYEDLKSSLEALAGRGWLQTHVDAARGVQSLMSAPAILDAAADESSFIGKIAATKMGMLKAADVEEGDLEATPTNLPFDKVPRSELAGPARTFAEKLHGDAHLQVATCEVINHHLDEAVQRVFGVKRGLVTDAALEVRRALNERGQRLWLLFEDFAVLQGLQRELLDTFTAFDDDLCPLRVVAAITPGPFNSLPTMIFGRSLTVVDLDIAAENTSAERRDLVARYLNATRTGQARLREHQPTIPNACDECPLEADRPGHAEKCRTTFGTVTVPEIGEISLFPLSETLLTRAAKKVNPDNEPFKPRYLITKVLRPLLRTHARELDTGEFPSTDLETALLANDLDLQKAVREDIVEGVTTGGAPLAERTARVAALYGDRPLGRIEPALAAALDVPAIERSAHAPPTTSSETKETYAKDASSPDEQQVPSEVLEIRRWLNARDGNDAASRLDRQLEGRIRHHLHERFVAAVTRPTKGPQARELSDLLDVFRPHDIVIDQRNPKARQNSLFDATGDDGIALEATVWDLLGLPPDASRQRYRHALDELLEAGERHVDHLLASVRDPEAAKPVLLCAAAAATLQSESVPRDLSDLLSPNRLDNPAIGWDRVTRAAEAVRMSSLRLLAAVHGIQIGGGAPLLDTSVLQPLLDEIDPDAALPSELETLRSEELAKALATLHKELEDRLPSTASAIDRFRSAINPLRDESPGDVLEGLRDAAETVGLARTLNHIQVPEFSWTKTVQTISAADDRTAVIAEWLHEVSEPPAQQDSLAGYAAATRHQHEADLRDAVRELLDWAEDVVDAAESLGVDTSQPKKGGLADGIQAMITRHDELVRRYDQ